MSQAVAPQHQPQVMLFTFGKPFYEDQYTDIHIRAVIFEGRPRSSLFGILAEVPELDACSLQGTGPTPFAVMATWLLSNICATCICISIADFYLFLEPHINGVIKNNFVPSLWSNLHREDTSMLLSPAMASRTWHCILRFILFIF